MSISKTNSLNLRQTGGSIQTSNIRRNVTAEQPKGRPPVSLRDKVTAALPRYSGVYSVGMLDIEIPVAEPRTFSNITRKKRHVLELETVLFSLYYPSALGSGAGPDPSGKGKWNRGNWLARPRMETSTGYAHFAGLPKWATMAFFLCTTWFTMIPAHRNAQLATHWPPEHNSEEDGWEIKNKAGRPPPGEKESPTFPILVFSHGLGGTRTTYSSVCGEFASYGFIVIALEHRDGSGPRTLVNHTKEGHGSREANAGKVDHLDKEFKRSYDKVDYIFPQGNPRDTDPHNEKGVDDELRTAQMELRKAEIKEVANILKAIWDGDGEAVAKQNLRKVGFAGASTRGLKGIDWAAWKHRFHMEQVTMLGHSFGAATTVECLRDRRQFPAISQGIIYDIWGAPVPLENEGEIKCPLLAINSEAFMYWEKNFDVVTSIIEEARSNGALCWSLTVQGTIHISQSDFQLLYPRICRYALKSTVDPQRAIALNINASLEFLKLVMPQRISAMNRGIDEGILNLMPLDSLPTVRRPAQEWIGMGLNAPQNLLRRPPKRKMKERRVEKEVWMHVAPSEDELVARGVRRAGEGEVEPFKRVSEGEEGLPLKESNGTIR